MRRILTTVTEEGGTGRTASLPGFKVAGKTGTAQKVEPGARGYGDKRIGSFIGFAPADDPKVVVLVAIDEPVTAKFGGVVAAPAFAAITAQTLSYMNVFPATMAQGRPVMPVAKTTAHTEEASEMAAITEVNSSGKVPNFKGLSMREALRLAATSSVNIKVSGNGKAVEQSPAAGSVLSDGAQVIVRFASPI
jgi:cell division protein FtsI (penicillin-binding protein 3)